MLKKQLEELVEIVREFRNFSISLDDPERSEELLDKRATIEDEIMDYLSSLSYENLYKLIGETYSSKIIVISDIQVYADDEPDENGNFDKDNDSIDIDFIVYEDENYEDGGWDSISMSIEKFNEFLENIEKEK